MTIPVYPSHLLPAWSLEDYSYRTPSTIQKTVFKSGRPRFRRISSSKPIYFNLKAIFKREQLELFEAWVYYTLKDVGLFNAVLLTSAGMKLWELRLDNNEFEPKIITHATTEIEWELSIIALAKKQIYMPESDMNGFIEAGLWDFGDRTQTEVKKYND